MTMTAITWNGADPEDPQPIVFVGLTRRKVLAMLADVNACETVEVSELVNEARTHPETRDIPEYPNLLLCIIIGKDDESLRKEIVTAVASVTGTKPNVTYGEHPSARPR